MKTKQWLPPLIACLLTAPAFAGGSYPATITTTPGTSTGSSRTDTRAYVGLNWQIGESLTPALVLGVANTKVKSNGNTSGARLAFHVNLLGGIAPGILKVSYLNGKEDLQGELAGGYNFITRAPLVGIGLSGPYAAAGIDGYLGAGITPYVTLHSQGAFDKPRPNTTPGSTVASCDMGGDLINPTTCGWD